MTDNAVAAVTSSLVFLAAASTLLILACGVFAHIRSSARSRRTIWRFAFVAMLLMFVLELSGATRGLSSIINVVRKSATFESSTQVVSIAEAARAIESPLPAALVESDPVDRLEPKARELEETKRSNVATDRASVVLQHTRERPQVSPTPDAAIADPLVLQNETAEVVSALADGGDVAEKKQTYGTTVAWLAMTGFVSLLAWLFVAVAFLVRVVASRIWLVMFRRQPRVRDADLLAMVRRLRRRAGLGRQVVVLESSRVSAPVAFGIWRPTIVLPLRFAKELSAAQQEVVLRHEVAHLVSRDAAWQLVSDVVAAVMWWNPLVWIARRRLQVASEWVADEACLDVADGPSTLADCLVTIGRRIQTNRQFAWQAAAGGAGRSALARRVKRLLEMSDQPPRRARRGAAGLQIVGLLGFTLLALGIVAWSRPWADFSKAEESDMSGSMWKRGLVASVVALWVGQQDDATARENDSVTNPAGVHLVAFYDEEDRQRGERDRPRREGERDGERERERDRPRDGDRERERPREGERDRPDAERVMRQFHERMEVLEREAHKLREVRERVGDDNEETAERIERRMHEIEREMHRVHRGMEEVEEHMRRRRDGDRDRPRHEGGHEAIHHRIEHLKRASAHLREAGFEEQAERVAEHAEHLMRELRGRRDGGDRDGRRHVRVERPDREHAEHEVHELREEVHDLRRELQRMRHLIREVLDEELDEDDEDDDDDDSRFDDDDDDDDDDDEDEE
ncbi:MAG: hypothetical protein MI757_16535 [Pirellulales bacterium]|nr:hypothetical protein [Pirellulales bacterium]